jgi:hypothetical protein
MDFTILGCLFVKKIKTKFLLASMESINKIVPKTEPAILCSLEKIDRRGRRKARTENLKRLSEQSLELVCVFKKRAETFYSFILVN